jgi:hypothetical protein
VCLGEINVKTKKDSNFDSTFFLAQFLVNLSPIWWLFQTISGHTVALRHFKNVVRLKGCELRIVRQSAFAAK